MSDAFDYAREDKEMLKRLTRKTETQKEGYSMSKLPTSGMPDGKKVAVAKLRPGGPIRYDLQITFTERVLGTLPKSKEVYARFIASKAQSMENGEEELETVQEAEESGWTGFARDENGLFFWDYQIRGFLKEQADALRQCGAHGVKGVKGKIDRFVFVRPRRCYILDTAGEPLQKPDGVVERPLRAETMRGPRVTLVRSDSIDAGRTVQCEISVFWPDVFTEDLLRAILDRAEYMGLGQWRTGSNGLFTYSLDAK